MANAKTAEVVGVSAFDAEPARAADNIKGGVYRSMVIDAPIDRVWPLIRQFVAPITPGGDVKIYPADPADNGPIVGKNRVIDSMYCVVLDASLLSPPFCFVTRVFLKWS